KLSTLDELVRHANASQAPDFSSFFPLVLEAGGHGNALAGTVLDRAGVELAALARNVIHRLFGGAGSVFRQSERVRQVFYNSVVAEFPQARVQTAVVDPVDGALELARKARH